MNKLIFLILLFTQLAFAEINLTNQEYVNFIIDHAESLNSYKAGMRFKTWEKDHLWASMGVGDLGGICEGDVETISTILLVGVDEKYYHLQEMTMTVDPGSGSYESCIERHEGKSEIYLNNITLITPQYITIRNLKDIEQQDFIELKKMGENLVFLKFHQGAVEISPLPDCRFIGSGELGELPQLPSTSKTKDEETISEIHQDFSLPGDFNTIKNINDGIVTQLSERIGDANLSDLNEKYKDLRVGMGFYTLPMPEKCLIWENIEGKKWGEIYDYGKR